MRKFVQQLGDVVVAPNTDSVLAFSATCGTLTGISNYSALYDRYRFNGIRWLFIPQFNTSATAAQNLGFCYSMRNNWSDNGTIPTLATCLNSQTARRRPFNKAWSVYMKPTITNVVSQQQGSTLLMESIPMRAPWLDLSTSSDVTHYGAKCLFNNPGANPCTWQVLQTVYVSFRDRNG